MIRVSTANLYLTSDANINADQSAMMTTQAELASGKQINAPSDNPVGAGEAALLQGDLAQLGQFSTNQNTATQLLNGASSTLTQAINVLQSVNSSLVEAGNGALNDTQRQAIAAQLQQQFNELVGLANTGDGQGGYLFGGSVNNAPPFAQSGNSVTYSGNNVVPGLQISATRAEQVKYAGNSVFMQLPTGNGTFVTAAGPGNQGSGVISTGSVGNPGQITGDAYTITFGAGGTTYGVTDNTTGTVVVPAGTAYANPGTISFGGMQMQISGTPAAGDTFTVKPSGYQSIFSTLASAISTLSTPSGTGTANAQISAGVTAALGNVQQAITNLSSTQSAMGAQLQELATYTTINGDQNTQDQAQMSTIVDLNYAQGASQLAQQQTQYQAALQSYAAISKLSLFNYV